MAIDKEVNMLENPKVRFFFDSLNTKQIKTNKKQINLPVLTEMGVSAQHNSSKAKILVRMISARFTL